MSVNRDEIFKLGVRMRIAQLEKEIEELRHLTRTKSHPKTATDLSAKPKKKVTPAQLANLKKAWAARSAQAKKERSGKEKEE